MAQGPSRQMTQIRALRRVCAILGGTSKAAAELGASEKDLHAWMEGDGHLPENVFLKAVELLLRHATRA